MVPLFWLFSLVIFVFIVFKDNNVGSRGSLALWARLPVYWVAGVGGRRLRGVDARVVKVIIIIMQKTVIFLYCCPANIAGKNLCFLNNN